MSWDLNLCMQHKEKVLVPFHYFVQPPQLTSQPSNLPFPFLSLPTDIQLIVYEHCDAPTLFHLMRTCSRMRSPATKLFWNSIFTDRWYHCTDYWLFEHDRCTYKFLRHCPEFARRITNVEIDLIRTTSQFKAYDEDCYDKAQAITATKAKEFWIKVEMVFPSVRAVVLSGCTPREASPPPPGQSDADYSTIETVVDCAPAGIEVEINFVQSPGLEQDRPPQNTLWRVGSRAQPAWRVLDPDWKPTRVLLPSRRWTVSPLGDFLKFGSQYESVILEMRGLVWLMIESYARYAIQDVIHCPRLDCPETFLERASWKQHLFGSGHGRFDIRNQFEDDPMLQLFCYKHTPEIERLAIEARQQHMNTVYTESAKVQRRVGYGWGPPGSEQRRLFEKEFITQMKEESVYTPERAGPEERSPEEEYFDSLFMHFDRNHVYHGCSGPRPWHICYEV